MNELESFMAEIQPVLLRYARRKWGGLFTSPEDLVQETLIYIWNNYDKKIKDHKEKEGHCCKALGYIALNTLLKEHKDGLWAGVSNSKTNCKGRIIETDFDYYDLYNEPINDIRDPWLEEFIRHRKEYNREYCRKWYLAHREITIERSKQYYKEHIEQRKQYYKENRAHILKRREEYYHKNRERLKEMEKERYYKVKAFRDEINQEYDVNITIKTAGKLYTAKRKSEEQFNDLIAEIIRNN